MNIYQVNNKQFSKWWKQLKIKSDNFQYTKKIQEFISEEKKEIKTESIITFEMFDKVKKIDNIDLINVKALIFLQFLSSKVKKIKNEIFQSNIFCFCSKIYVIEFIKIR